MRFFDVRKPDIGVGKNKMKKNNAVLSAFTFLIIKQLPFILNESIFVEIPFGISFAYKKVIIKHGKPNSWHLNKNKKRLMTAFTILTLINNQ